MRARAGVLGLLILVALSTACTRPGPGPIIYDTDACDHCRMTIADPKFAAQIVMRTGKRHLFDDPGCAAAFLSAQRVAEADIHSIWFNDHANPGTPVAAADALIVVSDRIRAPMNGRMAAFASRDDADALRFALGGALERWADIVKRGGS
jgi:copper chaperone NosL